MHPYVYHSIIHNSQNMEGTQDSVNRRMDKEVVMHTCVHTGILCSHKKGCTLATCDDVDEPRGYHAKWSKLDKERQIPYGLTYMWNLKTNKHK